MAPQQGQRSRFRHREHANDAQVEHLPKAELVWTTVPCLRATGNCPIDAVSCSLAQKSRNLNWLLAAGVSRPPTAAPSVVPYSNLCAPPTGCSRGTSIKAMDTPKHELHGSAPGARHETGSRGLASTKEASMGIQPSKPLKSEDRAQSP